MQDFKKVIKKISKNSIFIVILLIIFTNVSTVIENTMLKNDNLVQSRNKSMFRIMREKKNSIDIIMVGDSLSYCSFSPMVLWEKTGSTSYVCGQSGQKIQETYHMLETVFESQNPKIVVLETNTLFRGQPGLAGIKESIEEWGNYYISIFQGHDIWKSLLIDKVYMEENYKGFSFRNTVQPYKKGNYMVETDQKAEFPGTVTKYMKKIIELCKRNGSDLLLVGSPSPANYNYMRHNGIEDYAKKKNLKFIDLNLKLKEVGINWETDSLDKGDHLNLSGAEKVTEYLGKYLKDNYILKNHKGEGKYISWKKKADEYRKKADEYLKVIRKDEELR